MKHTSFRLILCLVILSLTATFVYQIYWLAGLYRTMNRQLDQGIEEALRLSDYNEMMLRIRRMRDDSREHGEVSVAAGYDATGEQYVVQSSTQLPDTAYCRTDTVVHQTEAGLSVNSQDGFAMILGEKRDMQELASYFQRGLHSGLDVLADPDVQVFDSLLTGHLQSIGISLPHRLFYLHRGRTADGLYAFTDTLAATGTSGYRPTAKARTYEYVFDVNSHHLYHLLMEPAAPLVWRQMAGILTTSFVILVVLGCSFWLLVRTLLRQRTLDEMKSDFTNNITHELKTPIAVAYAANDALLNFGKAGDETRLRKYLLICQEQLQCLSGLVEQILAMSMERRKTFCLHRETLSVARLLTPLIEQHKLKAGKPVGMTLSVEPEDLTVWADRTHFANMVSNLIDNAVKYSPDRAEVEIRCRRTGEERVEIAVSDHGIGIAPERQKHLFEKFYRVPTGNLHDVKGYGLGLFYVKTMAEKHGGSVSVESTPGRGSCFTIRI